MRYSIARFGSLMRLLCIRYSLLLRRPRSLLPRWLPLQAKVVGGAEEARTPDPLLAKEVLSQLSYGPTSGHLVAGDWLLVVEPPV